MKEVVKIMQNRKSDGIFKRSFILIFAAALLISVLAAAGLNLRLNPAVMFILLAVFSFVFSLLISLDIHKQINGVHKIIRELLRGHIHARCELHPASDVYVLEQDVNEFTNAYENYILKTLNDIADGILPDKKVECESGNLALSTIQRLIETMGLVFKEVNGVITAVGNGDLSERCELDKFSGVWKRLAGASNKLCDAVSEPINDVCDVISHYAVNDYTVEITNEYNGIFQTLSDDVNKISVVFKSIQSTMIEIANGDLRGLETLKEVGKLSENDNIIPSVIMMMDNINKLINEVKYLSEEAVNGDILSVRGRSEKFSGGYKEIVDGFNATLEAISDPLLESMSVLDKVASCDLSSRCSDEYKGDFAKLAKSVNAVLNSFLALRTMALKLAEGDLSSLDTLTSIGKMSEKDELVPAFTKLIENIRFLLAETARVADAAAEGDLDVRGDVSKLNGSYRKIIEMLNALLKAVDAPTSKVADMMTEIENGRIGNTIDGQFNGKYKVLVSSVNGTSIHLKDIIQEISDKLTQMSLGNFNLDPLENFPGDFEALSNALNTILLSINDLLGSVNQNSMHVAASSAQVSQGSQLLSQGATEQASAVEELSATVVEISERTKKNAENAGKASRLVASVKANANKGNMQMDEMLRSMNDISDSSLSISKIIKVIDDIAFQTNILSLNAAVEAARAGQYGKGFAVVADEVRNLAAKSAKAAKDTTDLIEASIRKVETGTKIAKETADSFGNIVSGVDDAAALVSEIAVSSNEQATGISQIDKGISQVSKVVQTNSATAEESAAASEELSGNAENLKEQIGNFKLRDTNAGTETAVYDENAYAEYAGSSQLEHSRVSVQGGFGKY